MNECAVARMLLSTLVHRCIGYTESSRSTRSNARDDSEGCGGFLCTGSSCDRSASNSGHPSSLCLYSVAYISVNTFMDSLHVIVPSVKQDANWSNYLDRQQVTRDENSYDDFTRFHTVVNPFTNWAFYGCRVGVRRRATVNISLLTTPCEDIMDK